MPALGLSTETWSAFGTIVTAIGTTATAVGVWYAKTSLKKNEEQYRKDFEDKLWQEYRSIVQNLPVGAMLGEELGDEEIEAHLKWFYIYFDLTNSQIFLRMRDRVRLDTWTEWCGGIRDNFRQPAIAKAWDRIKPKLAENSTLNELRRLEELKFTGDPRAWSNDGPA